MTNATLKALKDALEEAAAQLDNAAVPYGNEYQCLGGLIDNQSYEIIQAALTAVIEQHEDVEGDMPEKIWIQKNGTTIYGEKVIPPFSAHEYSKCPMSGKAYTKYTRADAILKRIEELRHNG